MVDYSRDVAIALIGDSESHSHQHRESKRVYVNLPAQEDRTREGDLNEVPSAFGSGTASSRYVIVYRVIRSSHMRIRATESSLQAADSKKKSIQPP